MKKQNRLRVSGEEGMIQMVRSLFPKDRRVLLGIGDDTAVLPWDEKNALLFTTDACVDGVDFRLGEASPEQIGRKVLAQNLSDIAAMGGTPLYAVMTLGFSGLPSRDFVRRFYSGVKKIAARFGVAIVGGDISRSGNFFASCSLLGKTEKRNIVPRSGARSGDCIFVTGELGGSILGRHLDFQPRVREARFLVNRYKIHSMIDLSDGLAKDLGHLLSESKKGAVLYEADIPVSKAARRLSAKTGKPPLRHAFCDGEDFELLFTVSPGAGADLLKLKKGISGTRVSCIGKITAGKGIYLAPGKNIPGRKRMSWKGFSHF